MSQTGNINGCKKKSLFTVGMAVVLSIATWLVFVVLRLCASYIYRIDYEIYHFYVPLVIALIAMMAFMYVVVWRSAETQHDQYSIQKKCFYGISLLFAIFIVLIEVFSYNMSYLLNEFMESDELKQKDKMIILLFYVFSYVFSFWFMFLRSFQIGADRENMSAK